MKAEKEQKEREKAEKKEKGKRADGEQNVAEKLTSLRSRWHQEDQQQTKPELDKVIVSNRCCVCYEGYDEEDDIEWVQCPCSQWLHEECILDTTIDAGKELLCPLYIIFFLQEFIFVTISEVDTGSCFHINLQSPLTGQS